MTDQARTRRGLARADSGFTLIEMMVTLGIIMVALGLMVPSLAEAFKNRRLNGAGSIVVRTLNQARNEAVSRKQVHAVVFLRNGVRLFREPKGADPGGFVGGVESLEPDDSGLITLALRFAGSDGTTSDLLKEINDEIEPGSGLSGTSEVYLRFMPDGTVDFRPNRDILTIEYDENRDADILVSQQGMVGIKGFVDVRATGRVQFKIDEVNDESE